MSEKTSGGCATYTPLTEHEIGLIRAILDDGTYTGQEKRDFGILCYMAENSLLFSKEIDRLRSAGLDAYTDFSPDYYPEQRVSPLTNNAAPQVPAKATSGDVRHRDAEVDGRAQPVKEAGSVVTRRECGTRSDAVCDERGVSRAAYDPAVAAPHSGGSNPPSTIYLWLVPSEEMLDQPGSWRIRKWDTEPFHEGRAYSVSTVATGPYEPPMVYDPKQGKMVKPGGDRLPVWVEEELKDGDRLCAAAGVQRTEGGRLPVAKIVNALRSATAKPDDAKDAARYRWLRTSNSAIVLVRPDGQIPGPDDEPWGGQLDLAIDEAMAADSRQA